MDGLMRHIEAARNVTLPGDRTAFLLGRARVGWVTDAMAVDLCASGCRRSGGTLVLDEPEALPHLARRLADSQKFRWRGEAFDVRDDRSLDGPVLSTIDRGALPLFGIVAQGVHVNGLVRRADGLHLWVGTRAADKPLDPGKLDHLVAGGVGAGFSAWQTLVKEAEEEAGIPVWLAEQAVPVGMVGYDMLRDEGLRRDRLHCFDLEVPQDFVPSPQDGEVSGFALWPIRQVMVAVRSGNAFKFNVNLVLIDLFLRLGLIDQAGAEGAVLRRGLTPPWMPETYINIHTEG